MLNKTLWTEHNQPVFTTLDNVMNAIRNDDMATGFLYDAPTLDDVLSDSDVEMITLDGIVVQNIRLKAKMLAMKRVMNQMGGSDIQVVDEPQISDPFMRLGTAQVAVLFPLSDGQAVTVYFHNPDVIPKKITPQDPLISFKFLLNKKDITIVVAPERGQEIDVRKVGARIMQLAKKNSAAFLRQNQRTAERKANIERLTKERDEKKALLAQKAKEIEILEALKAQEETDKALDEQARINNSKAQLDDWLKQNGYRQANPMDQYEFTLELADRKIKVISFNRNAQCELQLVMPFSLGGKTIEDNNYRYTEHKVEEIIEQLETFKTRDLSAAQAQWAEESKEEYHRTLKLLGIDKIKNASTPENQDEVINLTGKEFGEFDLNTKEGKETLRNKAHQYLSSLVANKESVFCKALNADVSFSQNNVDKYRSFSGNPIKSLVAIKIKEIIANGRQFKESQATYDAGEQKNKTIDHYLKTAVKVAGEEYGVRVVIREDNNGNLHYDLRVVDSVDLIYDTAHALTAYPNAAPSWTVSNNNDASLLLATNPELTNIVSGKLPENKFSPDNHRNNDTPILDSASSGYVLNLFVFDKDGNEIKDEPLEDDENLTARADGLTKELLEKYTEMATQKGYEIRNESVGYGTFNAIKWQEPYEVNIVANFKNSPYYDMQNREHDFEVYVSDTNNPIPSGQHFADFKTNDFGEALQFAEDRLSQKQGDVQLSETQKEVQYLQEIIDGKIDVFAPEFADKLEAIAVHLEGGEYDALLNQAVDYYIAKTDERARQYGLP